MSSLIEDSFNGILYRVATVNDRDNVLDFIQKHYYPEEPITVGNEPKLQDSEDEEFSISVIPHGTTIIAIDPTQNNRIVGALLSGPIEHGEAAEMIAEAKRLESINKSKKWSEILRLLAHLEECANIFERYNVTRALHIHVMGVDRSMRGKSIGRCLMNKCFEVAKLLGYSVISVDCTSIFSIRIAEKMQMECINELAYADYKDSTGRQLFKPPLPHTHIKTFTKIL